ncbi:hypothetical protein EZS27_003457 [termite gut metagenome]|uniref:Uncharacterized protein n=1 Tax=termite gut metagenome TaxID=433724 RepID=A0A5J4SSK3_9ZZZZ
MGVAIGAYRNIAHRRVGTYCSCPCYSEDIVFTLITAATYQYCRQGIYHCSGFPILFHKVSKIECLMSKLYAIYLYQHIMLVNFMFFFAVAAFYHAIVFVCYLKIGSHRFIISNALRIHAFYYTF